MSIQAMWVPGYAVIGQDPGVDARIERVGGGAAYDFGPVEANAAEQWFHFAIPTPVLVEDKRATLVRVMVLFHSDENFGPTLRRVDVWDGGNGIGQINRGVAGDYGNRLVDGQNVFDVNHDGIAWGVGVSLLVSQSAGGSFRFVSVGADFDYDL